MIWNALIESERRRSIMFLVFSLEVTQLAIPISNINVCGIHENTAVKKEKPIGVRKYFALYSWVGHHLPS